MKVNGNDMINLCIVVPCYNEQEVIIDSNDKLVKTINYLIKSRIISRNSKIMYVDDGSTDDTWKILTVIYNQFNETICIKLSKNVGHQNALYAGLMLAKENFDITISIDADLQDDLNVLNSFIEEFKNGAQIVFGVRKARNGDSFLKRNTALLFYKLMSKLGIDIIYNHADYRLISKKVLYALSEYKESNLFLRAIIPLLGYKSSIVYYDRLERVAGMSKYTIEKMFALAWNGITSFSIRPIRIVSLIGCFIILLGLVYMINILFLKYFGKTVDGWSSIVASIWLLGGIQILSIGIIGEYIGKIYLETKRRPRYNIESILNR